MKPYEQPTLTRLTPEEARLKLVQAAKDCLEKDCLGKMFPAAAKKSYPPSDAA